MTLDEIVRAAEEQSRRGWMYLPVRCDVLVEAIKAEREQHARELRRCAEAGGGGSRWCYQSRYARGSTLRARCRARSTDRKPASSWMRRSLGCQRFRVGAIVPPPAARPRRNDRG